MRRITTQFKQSRYKKTPKSILFGRVLLIFSSILLFAAAIAITVFFTYYTSRGMINWNSPLPCFVGVMSIPLAISFFIMGLAAFSYVSGRGRFNSIIGLTATLGILVAIIDTVIQATLLLHGFTIYYFLGRLGIVVLPLLLYFIGWFLAKNYLD